MVAQACDLYNREAEAGKLSQVQSQNELQSWDSSYKKETKDKEKVKKGKHIHTILCVQYLGWGSTRIKEGEEGEKESKNAKLCLPFLAAASFLSFLNFSKARRMSTILLVSDCFFLTSDKTPSAAALSSCSWRGKKVHKNLYQEPPHNTLHLPGGKLSEDQAIHNRPLSLYFCFPGLARYTIQSRTSLPG